MNSNIVKVNDKLKIKFECENCNRRFKSIIELEDHEYDCY